MKPIMKKFILLTLLMLPAVMLASVKFSINSGWQFQLENHKTCKVVNIPHTWNDDDQDDVPGYFRGKGIYRKTLNIESNAAGKRVFLYFEGANQVTTVKVNNCLAGVHKGGYTYFAIDITPYINIGEENILTVEVDNSHNKMIPPLSADYTFFGGIYRDVYLLYENDVHISMLDKASSGVYIRTPQVDENLAKVEIETLLNNYSSSKQKVVVECSITAPDGTIVADFSTKQTVPAETKNSCTKQNLEIKNPQLWDIDNPQLYLVNVRVKDLKGNLLDEVQESFGLRWFSFDADKGFFLNGRHRKLIGANRHQDFLDKGWALDDDYHLRDVQRLKDMGGNFLRIAHYPQDPTVLEACDRLGIVTSVEIPIVNAVTEDEEFLQNCLEMQQEMIKQSFNHPSVIIWAYMNEVLLVPPYKADDERYIPYLAEVNRQAKAIDAFTRHLDPQRYTMIPFNNAQQIYEDAQLYDVPMIVGWNIYAGWYSGTFSDLDEFLSTYRAKHPNIPTIISEYGADCDVRIHSDCPSRFDYSMEYADLFHEYYLKTILDLDYIAGANIWVLNSFSSESRSNAKPHVNLKGIMTQDRKPKNTYWLYKAHFSADPFVKIASADWTMRSGILDSNGVYAQEVKVYSNRKAVELSINGRSLGTRQVEHGFARFVVPLLPGKNNLLATADGYADATTITLNGIPQVLDDNFHELSVLMGSTRSVTNPNTGTCWIPEKEYYPGSWGYVGGEQNKVRNWVGTLPASDVAILNSELDPLYQTQRNGLDAFRADVPVGNYEVTLIWADLSQEKYEKLAYNLGNDVIHEESDNSFMVSVNGKVIYDALDIRKDAGRQTPLKTKVRVSVTAENPIINVEFNAIKGYTQLNAIRIVKTM